jgi:hypothetical protein
LRRFNQRIGTGTKEVEEVKEAEECGAAAAP